MPRLRTLASPVPGVQIAYDFVSEAEEQYLLQRIDAVGGGGPRSAGTEHPSTGLSDADGRDNGAESATTDAAAEPSGRRAWGWKDLNGRRSMYWGGTVTPSGSLVPTAFPPFMDSAWPNVLDRIAETGVYDEWTGGKGSGKMRGPNHCLVNEYLPGEGIMPHTDGPAYLPCTTTLSFGSHTVLHLRSKPSHLSSPSAPSYSPSTEPSSDLSPSPDPDPDSAKRASIAQVQKLDLLLPARSLLVLSDELYRDWLHGIGPLRGDSVEGLSGCANWEDWWAYRTEVAAAGAERVDGAEEGGGGGGGGGGAARVEAERRMVEEGKGWERQRRVSLTCRRVAGKVRNLGGILGGGGGAKRRQ